MSPARQRVDEAFDVLCGLKTIEQFSDKLPPDLINRQSIPENQKLVSLKPLIEHNYIS